MNFLVDTHVFLWIVFSPQKISKRLKSILLDPQSTKFVSIITYWEIALKYQLGKIDLKGVYPDDLSSVAKNSGFEFLNLEFETASTFYKLPILKNKDPFDRMLAWQAISKNYTLVTKDQEFSLYHNQGLKTVW